jgi:hypothetical protein
MNSTRHIGYIIASVAAAIIASMGVIADSPVLYGIIPGIIGGTALGIATVRFLKHREDLAGFVATLCGFVFYQGFQANPVTLPEFSDSLAQIPIQDQIVGIFLSNLTTAMLLIAFHVVGRVFSGVVDFFVPASGLLTREKCDRVALVGFWFAFVIVALPNVLFGQVVVGPIKNILYQRLAWSDAAEYAGYSVFGGEVGGSFANVGLWSVSLFIIWMYLLGSRYRLLMLITGPLVVLWTAAVSLQGSRTYIVALGIAIVVYVFGGMKSGSRAFFHVLWVVPTLFLLVQIMTYFRATGLKSIDPFELSSRFLEIRGNEGASSQMDGVEYFRTEIADRGIAPNPLVGFFRGMVGRPVEGVLMIVPRPLFPWKADDKSGTEYNLYFQRTRLGSESEEVFLGASPGLIGRELIKYGYLGPFTMLFWMGLILALADRFFSAPYATDFSRIFSATLVAFFIAQSRDFAPVWFIPFLPAGALVCYIVIRAKRTV